MLFLYFFFIPYHLSPSSVYSYTQIAKYWNGLYNELIDPINADLASSLAGFKMAMILPPQPQVIICPDANPMDAPEGKIAFPVQGAVEHFQLANAIVDQEARSTEIKDVHQSFTKKRKGG